MEVPTYSFVIPIYNEVETIPELFRRVKDLLDRLDGDSEVVLVNDGSRDGSREALDQVHRQDARFKIVHLSRNFGHQIAVSAGIDYSRGQAVVIMDADLQDPPEVVLEMAKKWREGYEVVYGVRKEREGETRFKVLTASLFYKMLRRVTDIDIPIDVGDFRLVDRKAVDAFKALRENSRYVRGMFSWIGFEQTGVEYRRDARFAGKTKYPLKKMLKLAADGVVSFSDAPLRVALNLGFFISALSLVAGISALILRLTGTLLVPGWASLIFITSFIGGIQLIVLGMMGEYVGRIFNEVKNRPLYLVRDAKGFSSWSDNPASWSDNPASPPDDVSEVTLPTSAAGPSANSDKSKSRRESRV